MDGFVGFFVPIPLEPASTPGLAATDCLHRHIGATVVDYLVEVVVVVGLDEHHRGRMQSAEPMVLGVVQD